eukprot:Lithocolla_globosa_v1_NODE_4937_length_1335_cov_12.213281.p4 type:complete len:130 gc:universal NODE_4937_length_1335_cov_12.213281:1334-945(-)
MGHIFRRFRKLGQKCRKKKKCLFGFGPNWEHAACTWKDTSRMVLSSRRSARKSSSARTSSTSLATWAAKYPCPNRLTHPSPPFPSLTETCCMHKATQLWSKTGKRGREGRGRELSKWKRIPSTFTWRSR